MLVTGPSAFAAAQVAIGALQYMPQLATLKPAAALPDEAGCFTGAFSTSMLSTLLLRQIRCALMHAANACTGTSVRNLRAGSFIPIETC